MRKMFSVCLLAAVSGSSLATEIIGRAGAIQVDTAQVRALVAALPEQSRGAIAKDLQALEQLIRSDLVSRAVLTEAKAAGFERKPDTVVELNRIHEQALAQLWLVSQSQVPAGYPGAAEIAAAFEQNKAVLQTATEYHLAQVFIEAPDAVEPQRMAAALRKVMDLAPRLAVAGADFGKLARENSDQRDSAVKDGDLGWLTEDKLVPDMVAAVRALKSGATAGPVKTAQGFHFVKMIEQRPSRPLTLEESRERLVAALRTRRAQDLQQRYLQELGTRLAVSINQVELANLQSALR